MTVETGDTSQSKCGGLSTFVFDISAFYWRGRNIAFQIPYIQNHKPLYCFLKSPSHSWFALDVGRVIEVHRRLRLWKLEALAF